MKGVTKMTQTTWDAYDQEVAQASKFVKFKAGEEITLELSNWKVEKVMDKIGINFNVIGIDGQPAKDKMLGTESRRLISLLRPIIAKAEKDNKEIITVKITPVGESFDRQYAVKDLTQ